MFFRHVSKNRTIQESYLLPTYNRICIAFSYLRKLYFIGQQNFLKIEKHTLGQQLLQCEAEAHQKRFPMAYCTDHDLKKITQNI